MKELIRGLSLVVGGLALGLNHHLYIRCIPKESYILKTLTDMTMYSFSCITTNCWSFDYS